MKRKTHWPRILGIWLGISLLMLSDCKAQKVFGTGYLKLKQTIVLPGVRGRIDHMTINTADSVVYISALGNNTVEAVDLKTGKDIFSIRGLREPQGICYIKVTHELFVANGGNGNCYFYNTDGYAKTGTIHLTSDADDVSYDARSHRIYVAYGEGGIAVIDAYTHKEITDYPLPAHPERFQIDSKNHRIYVNVPDAGRIDVIDMKRGKIVNDWKNKLLSLPKFNFPMALDTIHNRLFVGYRLPAEMVVLNSRNGKKMMSGTISGDPDDIFYDYATGRIYVSSGGGRIDIFSRIKNNTYSKIASIPSRRGARTSLLIPGLHLYLLAEPAIRNKEARLLVFSIPR